MVVVVVVEGADDVGSFVGFDVEVGVESTTRLTREESRPLRLSGRLTLCRRGERLRSLRI